MKEIAAALAKAQSEFKPAVFDKKNPYFNSGYASLTSVMSAVKEALVKNSLAISQSVLDGKVVTKLIHSSGESLETSIPLIIGKQDMQALGSAITYGRRYGISALLGIVTEEDDDGNAASGGSDDGATSGGSAHPNPKQGHVIKPGPNGNGHVMDKGYFIDFGKWNRKSLEQVMREEGPEAIRSYVDYLEEAAIKKNQPIDPNGKAGVFIHNASQFLAAFENGSVDSQEDIPF